MPGGKGKGKGKAKGKTRTKTSKETLTTLALSRTNPHKNQDLKVEGTLAFQRGQKGLERSQSINTRCSFSDFHRRNAVFRAELFKNGRPAWYQNKKKLFN